MSTVREHSLQDGQFNQHGYLFKKTLECLESNKLDAKIDGKENFQS
jgi:hypothetical protein